MSNIWTPQPKQAIFQSCWQDEALYGGAAGGGKSDTLLMEALRQIQIPNYKGVLVRKTFPQLKELIERSRILYKQVCPKARYNGTDHEWHFPSGASISFKQVRSASYVTDWQGQSYDFLGVDEATHLTLQEYLYLLSRNRPSGEGTRVYTRLATNPGGIGHGWIKARFGIGTIPPQTTIWTKSKIADPKGQMHEVVRSKIFIPATVFDNQELLKNNPGYLATLDQLPQAERDALLYGSWDSFSGQVFSEFRDNAAHYDDGKFTHVINPFPIPAHWNIIRCYDFGYTRPSACLWIAVNEEGRKFVIREFYTWTGTPDVGNKMHHIDQAAKIREIENTDPNLQGRNIIGVADPAIFDKSRGMSIADDMAKAPNYVIWHGGDHNRMPGKMQVHYHLAFDEDGDPMLQFFTNCKNIIRTLPELTYDETNIEDVNSKLEDHAYDALRYGLMDDPITPRANKLPQMPKYGDPLDFLGKKQNVINFNFNI